MPEGREFNAGFHRNNLIKYEIRKVLSKIIPSHSNLKNPKTDFVAIRFHHIPELSRSFFETQHARAPLSSSSYVH